MSHTLLVAATDHAQHAGAAAWVDHELAAGAKVYYKGWAAVSPETHWLTGHEGSRRARAAVGSGQLEFLDFPTVIELCGGTTEGLWRLQADEVERGLDEGWGRIAMAQESPHRPMSDGDDGDEAAELAAQESGYDRLAERRPLRVLCQLTLDEENPAAVRATTTAHHRDIVDVGWSARVEAGRWCPAGVLDVAVAGRFAAALRGALRDPGPAISPELHVDLTEVGFLDVAAARAFRDVAVERRPPGAALRIVLHGTGPVTRRLLGALETFEGPLTTTAEPAPLVVAGTAP